MSKVIVCRSSEQIYEDNVCELHTRLTRWRRELRNAPYWVAFDLEHKRECIKRFDALIQEVERAIERDEPVDIYTIERWAAYASRRLSL